MPKSAKEKKNKNKKKTKIKPTSTGCIHHSSMSDSFCMDMDSDDYQVHRNQRLIPSMQQQTSIFTHTVLANVNQRIYSEKLIGPTLYPILRGEDFPSMQQLEDGTKLFAKVSTVNSEPKVVSLDPGVRAFNTLYSPDGTHGELLVDALRSMKEMCRKMDKIRSDMDIRKNRHQANVLDHIRASSSQENVACESYSAHRRSMFHMKRRFNMISTQLKNWRNNAHYDAINFLFREFDVVLIPEFQTQKMSSRSDRNISSTVVRNMNTWSHYMFRSKLLSKSELDSNKSVKVIGEPGTSKTCGNCGHWKSDLGSNKTFVCPVCRVVLDRDVNGARNNMLALIH